MTINGRTKGATAERELAAVLMGWGRIVGVELDLSRNLEQTRGGGHDLVGLEPYGMAVEVKRCEILSLPSWWRQASRQAIKIDCKPVLAWRQNRKPWTFRIEAFVWPCAAPVVIDLDEENFRRWFLAQISYCKRPLEQAKPKE